MTEFETTDDRDPSAELEEFLEREWDLWHAQEGHDPDQDWSSLPIRFVAREANGLIVGAARGRIAVGMGYLDELMVAKEHRGRGIGGNLVERFETLCFARGCHKLAVLTVHKSDAHAFYLGHGWRDEAVFPLDRGRRDFVRLYKYAQEIAED